MRTVLLGALLIACSSSKEEKPPQPTTPCGQSIAVVGGAMEATIAQPDAEAFRMGADMAPDKSCAGVSQLVNDWEAHLKAPTPERKAELLTRLEQLAAQHGWTPSARIQRAIEAARQ